MDVASSTERTAPCVHVRLVAVVLLDVHGAVGIHRLDDRHVAELVGVTFTRIPMRDGPDGGCRIHGEPQTSCVAGPVPSVVPVTTVHVVVERAAPTQAPRDERCAVPVIEPAGVELARIV